MTDTFPILLTGKNLPTLHQEREALADSLADAGFMVQVNRFGSGNAKHSGRNGNGVNSLLIVRRLDRCEVESVRDVYPNSRYSCDECKGWATLDNGKACPKCNHYEPTIHTLTERGNQ